MLAQRLGFAVMVSWLVFAACVTPGRGKPRPELPAPDGGVSSSTLGSGDMLEVRVFQEADLSGVYRVAADGAIDFPLCGRLQVLGATSGQVADVITNCLKNGFVKRPQVSVMVKDFNSKKIFVFGEVIKPGAFAYEENMTIIHAVTGAGGFSRAAAKNDVNVTRVIDGKEVKVPVRVEDIATGRERNFQLVPGDIIFVPEGFL